MFAQKIDYSYCSGFSNFSVSDEGYILSMKQNVK